MGLNFSTNLSVADNNSSGLSSNISSQTCSSFSSKMTSNHSSNSKFLSVQASLANSQSVNIKVVNPEPTESLKPSENVEFEKDCMAIEKDLVIEIPQRLNSSLQKKEISRRQDVDHQVLAETNCNAKIGVTMGNGNFEKSKENRDDIIIERQMQLESSTKQQLFILQEMCGKLDVFKSSLEVLNSKVKNLESKTTSSNTGSSVRPSQKDIVNNLHKGRPAWGPGQSVDGISELNSFRENDFCFENLRLNQITQSKEKLSAPKLLSQSKKINKNFQASNTKGSETKENSGKQSAKFNIKRNLMKSIKEKNSCNQTVVSNVAKTVYTVQDTLGYHKYNARKF